MSSAYFPAFTDFPALLTAILLSLAKLGYSLENVYLLDSCTCAGTYRNAHCDSYILGPVEHGSANIVLGRSGNFHREFKCKFVLEAPSEDRIQLRINSLQIPWTKECRGGMLRIYDGAFDTDRWQAIELCGAAEGRVFRSTTSTITLFYSQTTAIQRHPKSFNLTFNYFHLSDIRGCDPSDSFQCRNGLCIPTSLLCDGYDHCGDDTDESEDYHVCGKIQRSSPLTGMALGITLGCVVICGLAGVIAYSMRKRKDSFNTSQVDQSLVCTAESGAQTLHSAPPGDPCPPRAFMTSADDVITLSCDGADCHVGPPSLAQEDLSLHRQTPPPSYSSLFPDK